MFLQMVSPSGTVCGATETYRRLRVPDPSNISMEMEEASFSKCRSYLPDYTIHISGYSVCFLWDEIKFVRTVLSNVML